MQKTELPCVAVLHLAGDDVGDHQVHVQVGPDGAEVHETQNTCSIEAGDDAESELLHVAAQ